VFGIQKLITIIIEREREREREIKRVDRFVHEVRGCRDIAPGLITHNPTI
jgi:hypothetical protein